MLRPFLCVVPLLTTLALSQAEVARTAFGVRAEDGVVTAIGPDFGATFSPGGIAFTPVLGASAEVPATVRYTWTDVQRGGVEIARCRVEVAPEVSGQRVSYRRSADLLETYDVRRDGIEQSFVFARRPAGDGDLVVRGQITTALAGAYVSELGARFTLPSGDGVSFGAVTGIDANGATVRGALRLVGTTLELSLPDAFVDAAAYPLVLDPLLGSIVAIGDVAGAPDRNPSVAYDEATNRHLVVWNVQYAASSWEVRGQLTNGSGQPLSTPPMTISAPGVSTAIDRCCAASVRGVGRFVVAMRPIGIVGGLAVRSISATLGTMAAITPLITNPTLDVTMATVGGDSRVGGSNALVGYVSFNSSNGFRAPHTTMLTVAPAGTITTVLASNPLVPNGIFNPEVAVSRHGGLLGNWLAAWTDQTGSGAMRKVNAVVVGPAGTACSPIINVEQTNSGAETCSEVACATRDGALGLVTWTYSFGGSKRVHAKLLVATGSCGAMTTNVGNPVLLAAGTGLRDRPAVDFAADKFVATFRERQAVGGQARVVVQSLDLNQGTPAGAEHYPSGWLPTEADPTITAKWSGGSTADEALVAWSDDAAVAGHRFEATGAGLVTAAGGGCGYSSLANDWNTYTGLPTLGQPFAMELAAPTFPVLALVVGFIQVPAVCGPCTLVPSLDLLLAPVNPTVIAVPNAPSLIGAELHSQWVQLRQSGCAVLPDFGFTNALKFTIAE